jgi:alanine-glyoxylate transaminase/(R)-3-amino-2-methylpropionate-pyruvate transaminase
VCISRTGNPVACAVGRAVLETIDREKIQQKALILGKRLKDGLNKLKEKHDVIGDVRGKGFVD